MQNEITIRLREKIMLDGVEYYEGQTIVVSYGTAKQLIEQKRAYQVVQYGQDKLGDVVERRA